MLVRFEVENFLSFRDRVEFSMVAGNSTEHPEHITDVGNDIDDKLLKTGVIYGANAAGKSNLVKALQFAQSFIVSRPKSDERINAIPFLLDRTSEDSPSKFEFEIKCNSGTYIYGFEVDNDKVHSEHLAAVCLDEENTIYTRDLDKSGNQEVKLEDIGRANEKDNRILNSTRDILRSNELFLSKIVDNNITYLKDVHDWFRDTLKIVLPDGLSSLITKSYLTAEEFERNAEDMVSLFDLGIDGVELRDFSTDPPADDISEVFRRFGEEQRDVTLLFPSEAMVLFLHGDEHVRAAHVMTMHEIKSEKLKVVFNLRQESDGTRRLFDLSWAFMSLLSGSADQVLIIDELDLRLHPHMTTNILDIFLTNSVGKRSQFIATTHEAGLLDLDLLRKDEIWFIEKDGDGNSTLYSLEEFVPQYDRDIQAGYLQGRFGAIPIVPSYNILDWAK